MSGGCELLTDGIDETLLEECWPDAVWQEYKYPAAGTMRTAALHTTLINPLCRHYILLLRHQSGPMSGEMEPTLSNVGCLHHDELSTRTSLNHFTANCVAKYAGERAEHANCLS